nr:GPI-anchored protein LLG1 [Ipomoea batatas]
MNDLTNYCATTMFSYINLYGKYPPGLFANECKGDKKGLECPALSPSELSNDHSGTYINYGVFVSQSSTGRNLLQAKKACPINFEFQNYTVITSQCKGPQYPPKQCCGAFTEFACPYAEYLNDLTNDCASTMFSYINLYGKYPPGLFANECKGDKKGLECPALSPSQLSNDHSGTYINCKPSSMLVFAATFLVLLARFI